MWILHSNYCAQTPSFKFKTGPTGAITHYVVSAYASLGKQLGGGCVEVGRPQLLQLSSGASATAQQTVIACEIHHW